MRGILSSFSSFFFSGSRFIWDFFDDSPQGFL